MDHPVCSLSVAHLSIEARCCFSFLWQPKRSRWLPSSPRGFEAEIINFILNLHLNCSPTTLNFGPKIYFFQPCRTGLKIKDNFDLEPKTFSKTTVHSQYIFLPVQKEFSRICFFYNWCDLLESYIFLITLKSPKSMSNFLNCKSTTRCEDVMLQKKFHDKYCVFPRKLRQNENRVMITDLESNDWL